MLVIPPPSERQMSYAPMQPDTYSGTRARKATETTMKKKILAVVFTLTATIAVVGLSNYTKPANTVNAAGLSVALETKNNVSPPPAGFGPMKTVEIVDPMFNMVAYSMQIPTSWKFESTVLHGPGCLIEYAGVAYRAYSPDMLFGVQAIPSSEFYWADDPKAIPTGRDCKNVPPISAADYGKLISIRMRPGSEVDSVETSANEANYQATIEKNNAELARQAAASGNRNPSKYKGEIKRLHIHYDLNGHAEEEWLNVAMEVGDLPTSIWVNQQGRPPQLAMKHRIISTVTVSGSRAPQGQWQANADAIRAIGMSIKANPEYTAKFAAYMQDKTNKSIAASWAVTHAILQKGAQEQAQRTQQAQQFIQNMQQQGDARRANFNTQMDRKSAHAQDVCDYLLDQQLYVNPTTGEKSKASNQYNHTYSNGGNTVVQTNSPTYNPNGLLQGNWTELQPINH
jgi:hypothetical protein